MEPLNLPRLAPVILPRAMRETKVLGSQPGACIGPKCAHGGLHFTLAPLSWNAAPKRALPLPDQMPRAAAVQIKEWPSIKWQEAEPVAWHNQDGVFAHRERAAERNALHQMSKVAGAAAAAAAAHTDVEDVHHQIAAQKPTIMASKQKATQVYQSASNTHEHTIASLAQKLAKQIAQTGAALPSDHLHASAAPAAATPRVSPPVVYNSREKAIKNEMLHKLAAAKRAAHGFAAAGMPSLASNTSWADGLGFNAVGASVIHAKEDVDAAAERVEHRVNPYDVVFVRRPPSRGANADETAYEYGLEIALVVTVLLLVLLIAWVVWRFCSQKSDYLPLGGSPSKAAERDVGKGPTDALAEGDRGMEIDEIKLAINSVAERVRQVEVKNLNHERRLTEVRSDVDDIIQRDANSRAKGAAAIRQSGRATDFRRELEAMGLGKDSEGSKGLYSFVRPDTSKP